MGLTTVVTERCQGCGACLLTCPERAIRPHGTPLTVLADRCTGCLECVEICPADAIDVIDVIDAAGSRRGE
ncbi:MAG TPA: 4Fe-4S binding protein [Thermomonospora sp.]|nr:4Fe-4S binding protein [Thermomonospora sp.]